MTHEHPRKPLRVALHDTAFHLRAAERSLARADTLGVARPILQRLSELREDIDAEIVAQGLPVRHA